MNDRAITPRKNELSPLLTSAGQAANEAARASTFTDYRSRKANSTIARQDADLATFATYLAQATGSDAITGNDLARDPHTWCGITWGLVDGFVKWALLQEYAVGTVNLKLSTVKTYCKLAARAGAVSSQELALIRSVSSYSRKEGKRIDERRAQSDIATRSGSKKRDPIVLNKSQAGELKAQPDTPQGRRDRLLVCLMLDLGLRRSEVAGLTVDCVDLQAGELTFYRQKVDIEQTHSLINGLQKAMSAYLANDAPGSGPLLRSSRKGGHLTQAGMSERAITARVRYLGERIGITGLSPHDLRHTWATLAVRNGTPLDRLQDAGGWASLAMPMRYVEAAKVANQGVVLE
ncbi:MAG: site-specific integrase [Aestuariibacter sp.]|nr:site-specific integrase [Aestuariibacter sp.]